MKTEDANKVTNFLKSQDPKFIKACGDSGIEPTKRQASKWLMKKGKAYAEANHV